METSIIPIRKNIKKYKIWIEYDFKNRVYLIKRRFFWFWETLWNIENTLEKVLISFNSAQNSTILLSKGY